MKKLFKKKQIALLLSPLFFVGFDALATCTVVGTTLSTDDTVYYCNTTGMTDVIITTNQAGGISPLTGYGVYNQTGTLNNVTITTTGNKADGIMVRSAGYDLDILGKLIINANGPSANGINLAVSAGAKLTVADGAYVYTKAGIAIRSNLTNGGKVNSIVMGDNLTVITDGTGSNVADGAGYAVYAGSRDTETDGSRVAYANTATVDIGNGSNLTTNGNNAHAVYANKTGKIKLGSTNITTYGTNAHGLYTSAGSINQFSFSCLMAGNCFSGSFDSGTITLSGDTKITVNTANDGTTSQSYAIYSSGTNGVIQSDASSATFNTNVYKITGDIKADTGGGVYLTMGDGSIINGNSTVADINSKISLDIKGATSQWNMTKSSSASYLNLDSSTASLGDQTIQLDGTNSVTLTLNELAGSGIFNMRTTVDNVNNYHDLLEVLDAGKANGSHQIAVNDSKAGAATVNGTERVQVVKTEGGNAAFTGATDIGGYTYNVIQGDTAFGERTSDWYLASNGTKSNPGDNSINIANTNYLLNYIETQTLLQRMGELRATTNETGDAWGRIYSGSVDSFENQHLGGKKFSYTGFQLGVDKNVNSTEQWDVYVGFVAGLTKGKTDFKVGNGDTTSYYAGVYGTYKEYNGFYLDLIAKYMYMDNKINTTSSAGYAVNGSGSTDGLTVSFEGGKRVWLNGKPTPEKGSWFIEPQAQLTYGYQNSTTIKSSNGLETKLDDFDSIITRVSTLIGYSAYAQGENNFDVYAKLGFVNEHNANTAYQFNNGAKEYYSYKDDWFEMGLGVNAQISGQHNLYADLNYQTGDQFDLRQINLGYRYNF